MPYVSVPQDLSNVKNKVALGLTKRQLLAISGAVFLYIPIFLLTFRSLGDFALYLAIVPAIPCFLIGFYKGRDNRPLERIVLNYVRVRFKYPYVRPYKTDNTYKRLGLLSAIEEVEHEGEYTINEQLTG